MNIGLFDLYTSGHHLPYASRVKTGLQSATDSDVTFVTLSETDRCANHFEPDEIEYLDKPDTPAIENRTGDFTDIADRAVERFIAGGRIDEYDVVHFLYADDILGPLWRHGPAVDGPNLVVELNGVFFKRGTILRSRHLHPLFLRVLESHAGALVDSAVPPRSAHETLWRDLYLYRCLRSSFIDTMLVHSREANEYVSRLNPNGNVVIECIPYPGPRGFGKDISKKQAREQLDLDSDVSILLYFGTLRGEKGIHHLLEALRQYRGPTFTMLIAGPPVSVSEEDIDNTSRNAPVEVVSQLDFITNPEPYYRAADAIILPYRWEFGKECTSQSLDEACSAMRPVIVPDFGAIGRFTEEWELGVTFQQESIESLHERMEEFAIEGVPFSEEQMERYNSRHDTVQVASDLMDVYSAD